MLGNTNKQTAVLPMCSNTNLYHPDVCLFMILSGWWADSSLLTYMYIHICIGPRYSNPSEVYIVISVIRRMILMMGNPMIKTINNYYKCEWKWM